MRCLVAPAIVAAALATAPRLPAQAPRPLAAPTPLLSEPNGRAVADLRAGAPVVTRATRGAFTMVVVEGYVDTPLLGGRRDTFPAHVMGANGAPLRASADGGPVIALLGSGSGVTPLARGSGWTRVRRVGWVSTQALDAPATAAGPAPVRADARKPALDAPSGPSAVPTSQATAPQAPGEPPVDPAALLATTGRATLRGAPDGAAVAAVERGVTLVPLARERGWVRVRVEGWVRESETAPADTTILSNVSAAGLRSNPQAVRGKLVRWDVELLALQTSDGLRKDLAPDEPYFLARGPGEENAVLYLAVPASLLESARQLRALTKVTIVARVRSGRSEPAGVPVLDLVSIARR